MGIILIFEFLSQESLKLFDVKNIIVKIENIVNLYEVLCMEYYFNNKEFIYIIKNDELNVTYKKYLLNFDISNSNNENTILTKYFNSFNNIICDKLLFISKNFDLVNNKVALIKIYFYIISQIIKNIKNKGYIDKYRALLLSQVANILYKYLIHSNFDDKILKIYVDLFLSTNPY